jgi:RHS repeat-associated protein
VEVSLKRYRFTGKERDDETGLNYHGARYYAPWLGRWTAPDPIGIADGVNIFGYVHGNPLTYLDPTGSQCDPTAQSCIDPTEPTEREQALQQSLPDDERDLPAPPNVSEARYDLDVSEPPVHIISEQRHYGGGEFSFALRHPFIAHQIGSVDLGNGNFATNVSTVAARFAVHSGLDDTVPGKAEGTDRNAFRHTVWQAMISYRYGNDIAKRVGYAHEEDPLVNRGIEDFHFVWFDTLSLADQSADLKNNELGREIATAYGSNASVTDSDFARYALRYFHEKGLWVAVPQYDDTFQIEQKQLSNSEYLKAYNALSPLNRWGFTPDEQKGHEQRRIEDETFFMNRLSD